MTETMFDQPRKPAEPSRARVEGGRRARNAGKDFESLIEASQNDAQGPVCVLARIKNYAQMIPEKRPAFLKLGQRMILMQQRSQFDFAGACWGSGVGIFLDAKRFAAAQASFPSNSKDHVKPHQIHALQALEAADAIAGFLVECGRAGDWRFLRASHADERKPVRPWCRSVTRAMTAGMTSRAYR